MSEWRVQADVRGTPDEQQQQHIAEADDVVLVHFNSSTRTGGIRFAVQAPNLQRAVFDGFKQLAVMEGVQDLIAAGVLSQPYRLTVEAPDAPPPAPAILSTKGLAELLGMSDVRVRQLKDDVDFPQPITIPGAAGEFYFVVDAEAYRTSRRPGRSDQGKPRATDEPELNYALLRIGEYPALTEAQRYQVERAGAAEGGRYVRGKAKVVLDMMARHGAELWKTHAQDLRFGDAVSRARVIWGDE